MWSSRRRRSFIRGLNPGPRRYKHRALPTELIKQIRIRESNPWLHRERAPCCHYTNSNASLEGIEPPAPVNSLKQVCYQLHHSDLISKLSILIRNWEDSNLHHRLKMHNVRVLLKSLARLFRCSTIELQFQKCEDLSTPEK